MFSIWIIIFLVKLNIFDVESQSKYEYQGPLGVNNWNFLFRSCSGRNQSPIDLSTSFATRILFPPLKFENYIFYSSAQLLLNNGHTVKVTEPRPDNLLPSIEGGDLPFPYKLAEFHFHWGAWYGIGSEHTIEGRAASLEMHLVHIGKQYNSVREALNRDKGIAVLGILFNISRYDNHYLNALIEGLSQVQNKGSSVELRNPVLVDKILPPDLTTYYRYDGSLTTPTCNEGVLWTVFDNFVPVSERQLNALRQLRNNEQKSIVDNFRPIQPLNGRTVYKVFGYSTKFRQ